MLPRHMSSPADNEKLVAAALKRLESLQRSTSFDPARPGSTPTAMQQQVIDDFGTIPVQYIVAGNQSGKTMTSIRLLTWAMTDTHPNWKRPVDWANESLLCIIASRTGKQIEESLLPKMRACLQPGTYKEIRVGNIIQRLELDNGNRFLFQSLENPNQARERLQSYVAHFAFCDEMPPTVDILTELLYRVNSRSGYFLSAFTPLVEDVNIQRMVDASKPPYSKKYQFAMLDNPLYADPEKQTKVLQELSTLPESVRRTRLFGDWSSSDSAVYHFDYHSMVRPLPPTYQHSWRHVISVDPALRSALGLIIAAEDPFAGHWYIVQAEEIRGIQDPIEIEATVHRKTLQYNIVRRIADPHEVWWMETTRRNGRIHMGVYKKNSRKGELIKGLQQALGSKLFICPHLSEFIDQLVGCKWAEGDRERIINASSKHMLDAAQYLVDNLPKHDRLVAATNWEASLYLANQKRLEIEEKAARSQARHQLGKRRIRRR
jgi:phage terminase large subunit-like protein